MRACRVVQATWRVVCCMARGRQQGRIIDAVIPHLRNCTNGTTSSGKSCTIGQDYDPDDKAESLNEFTNRIMVR